MDRQTKVTGVILAGGLARRMNRQDKGLILFKHRPLVSYAVEAMTAVANRTVINANRNIGSYREFGLPVISDQSDSFDGPLAGILSAMHYAESGIVLAMPCDSPFFNADHLTKLLESLTMHDVEVATAFDGERLHPVFLALNVELSSNLEDYLQRGQRKVENWIHQQKVVFTDYSKEPDIFININSIDELSELETKNPWQTGVF